jgi:hypothetical protein
VWIKTKCDIHGEQSRFLFVSSGVFDAIKEKKSNTNIVYLILLREGELEGWLEEWLDEKNDEESRNDLKYTLYFSRTCYIKKEELNVFSLAGRLIKQGNKYEYVMMFKDDRSIEKVSGMRHLVCSQCFSDFVSNNPEIIYPYHSEEVPPDW